MYFSLQDLYNQIFKTQFSTLFHKKHIVVPMDGAQAPLLLIGWISMKSVSRGTIRDSAKGSTWNVWWQLVARASFNVERVATLELRWEREFPRIRTNLASHCRHADAVAFLVPTSR